MLCYILDNSLRAVGAVDTFISLIWYTKCEQSSSFELYVPATEYYRRLLRGGRFVKRYDSNHPMYIYTVEEKHDRDGKKLIVRGKGAESLLSRFVFPVKQNREYETLFDVFDDIKACEKLQCPIQFEILSSYPLRDIPSDYLDGNLEDLTRYILSRTNTIEDPGSQWYKLVPQSFILRYNDGTDGQYPYPYLWFDIIDMNNVDYMPTLPTIMLCEDIGNISDATYSYSEEECYSHIFVKINTGYTQTFTETRDGETKEVNIGFNDIDLVCDSQGRPPELPSYEYQIWDAEPIQRNEKVITADPVYEKYRYVPPADPDKETPDYYYEWQRDAKMDKPYQAGTYHSHGKENRRQKPPSVVEEERTHYQINAERTMNNMIKAAHDEAMLATENFQGTFQKIEREQNIWACLGKIVIFRDNVRGKDYYKRITEIEEVWDETGHRVVPVFGDPIKTIWDLI